MSNVTVEQRMANFEQTGAQLSPILNREINKMNDYIRSQIPNRIQSNEEYDKYLEQECKKYEDTGDKVSPIIEKMRVKKFA